MSQGLQVFKSDGTLSLDLSDRVTRVLGIISMTANGSVTIAESGTPFAFLSLPNVFASQKGPIVSISNNVISWTISDYTGSLVYGVY